MDSNNLRDKMQSAYRKLQSTETAITRIHNDILRAIDRGECTALIMLDLSAAFDTVNHLILLKRLQDELGIHNKALQWLTSYLHDRTQQVVINEIRSQPVTSNINIPQGSIFAGVYLGLGGTRITPSL